MHILEGTRYPGPRATARRPIVILPVKHLAVQIRGQWRALDDWLCVPGDTACAIGNLLYRWPSKKAAAGSLVVLLAAVGTLILAHSRMPIFVGAIAIMIILIAGRHFRLAIMTAILGTALAFAVSIDDILEYIYRGQSHESVMGLTGRMDYWGNILPSSVSIEASLLWTQVMGIFVISQIGIAALLRTSHQIKAVQTRTVAANQNVSTPQAEQQRGRILSPRRNRANDA